MPDTIEAKPMDFSSLALDAAIQLDRLGKHKQADLSVIDNFAKYLAEPSGHHGNPNRFCLQEDPVSVDIFNSAISKFDGAQLVSVAELEARVVDLISRAREVASGRNNDENQIESLKKFCLSLHRVLLEELSQSVENDEWVSARDERFA